jgi:hypothetical protein
MSCSQGSKCALLLTIAALAVGCGEGGGDTTTVRGKVTYSGAPVTSGLINFQAAGAKPLGGEIGADGSYEFDLPPGEYTVRIDTPPPMPAGYKEGDPLPKLAPRQVPEKYSLYDTSGLTVTVGTDSPQQQDFALP